jgi:jmjN domain
MSNEEVLLLQQAIENSRVHQYNTDVVGSSMPEAPSFHPTLEEFKDPLAYIKSLQAHGERYGIIKIVPPKGWAPPPPPHLLQSTTATASSISSSGSTSNAGNSSGSASASSSSSGSGSSSEGSSSDGATAAAAATGSDVPPVVPPAALRFTTKLQQIHELQQGSDYGEGRMYTAAGIRPTMPICCAHVPCITVLCCNAAFNCMLVLVCKISKCYYA